MKILPSMALLAGVASVGGCSDSTASPAPERLAFTVEPLSVAVGALITPAAVVVVRDEEGTLAGDWKDAIALTLVGGDPQAELAGTSSRIPIAGTAVFDDLEITTPGEGFSLKAQTGGLSEALSVSFDVHARLASAQVAAGFAFTCALSTEGEAFCWGDNRRGQLGDGTVEARPLPVKVATEVRFTSLSAGDRHVCGLTSGGGLYCWGSNYSGELGLGLPDGNYPVPAPVPLPASVTNVAAGGSHTCALLEDGTTYCWGYNGYGQVGMGVTGGEYSLPTAVTGGHRFKSIGAGAEHTCGLTLSGSAYCWGENSSAQLGQGAEGDPVPSPTLVHGNHVFQDLVAGGGWSWPRSCGLAKEGTWYCWGRTRFTFPRSWTVPTALEDDPGFHQIILGGGLLCGLPGDGTLACLGNPGWGMLGEGNFSHPLTPVAEDLSVVSVAVGYRHICVSTSDQGTYCWGSNLENQLGNASNPHGWYVPMPVWAPAER